MMCRDQWYPCWYAREFPCGDRSARGAARRRRSGAAVVGDGGRDDAVRGVEVAVGEVVQFVGQQAEIDGFDGLADLDQAHVHRVVDQSVAEAAALDVFGDGVGGGEDIGEALIVGDS
jgi:hypothetical protein